MRDKRRAGASERNQGSIRYLSPLIIYRLALSIAAPLRTDNEIGSVGRENPNFPQEKTIIECAHEISYG